MLSAGVMNVPSPVSPEFTPGSLKLRSWTLSRKQRLVSNTATVSEQSEQLDIVNAHHFSHLYSFGTLLIKALSFTPV